MHCHTLSSLLVFFSLFTSLVFCLVALFSQQWWHGEFEVIIPMKRLGEDKSYELHWLFAVSFGLQKVCWRAEQAKFMTDSADIRFEEQFKPARYCFSAMSSEFEGKEEEFRHFRKIFIALIIAVIFNMLSFSSAFYKLPCIKKYRQILIAFTVVSVLIAILPTIAVIAIANSSLHFNEPFMKTILETRPYLGPDISATTNFYLDEIFSTTSLIGSFDRVSSEFMKGYPYALVCLSLMLMILTVVMSVFEYCFMYRYYNGSEYIVGDEEYNATLNPKNEKYAL